MEMNIYITDIQHFSLHDGDGIRTTVFFKGCNLHCPWCHNPETVSGHDEILHYEKPVGDKVCGKLLDIRDCMKEILEDVDFYEDSAGGVTFSGGEVLLQADAASELARLICNAGISVIVDTAGSVDYENFEKLNPYVSEYYFDLKASNANDYSMLGGDFFLVTENMKRLVAEGIKARARIPLIPGFNDSFEYSEKMCEVLKKTGLRNVDLLPFHRLGSGKYKAMNLTYAYSDTEPLSFERAEEISQIYKKYFNTKIER